MSGHTYRRPRDPAGAASIFDRRAIRGDNFKDPLRRERVMCVTSAPTKCENCRSAPPGAATRNFSPFQTNSTTSRFSHPDGRINSLNLNSPGNL